MLTQFCLYPIQRIASYLGHAGSTAEDFDPSILPLSTVEGATIEDVSALIAEDEFDYLKGHLPDDSIKQLERTKYAIVHRAQDIEIDGQGRYLFAQELLKKSQNIVAEIAACLRLIRPTMQKTQMCWGTILNDGRITIRGFNNPLEFVEGPSNQRFFTVRANDIQQLLKYAPLFRQAMHGPHWKFRMAVHMHEAGHFQNTDWKARFFLWTSALESLFTSKPQKHFAQHSGSLVASERIKFLIGAATPIYPLGDLTSFDANPALTVKDVIGEIYCLRNHIAHGDKVPDWYFNQTGRVDSEGDLNQVNVLMEAMSLIVRRSLLTILEKGLLRHFDDVT